MSRKKSGNSSRSAARLYAIQAIFQLEQSEDSASTIVIEFLERRLGFEVEGDLYLQADTTLFSTLVQGTADEQVKIDELIVGYLNKSWRLERIESVLRAILRVAIYEILHAKDTPVPVILNEYLDVTRAFYDSKEVGFMNGILDKVAKDVRPQVEGSTGDSPVSV